MLQFFTAVAQKRTNSHHRKPCDIISYNIEYIDKLGPRKEGKKERGENSVYSETGHSLVPALTNVD